MLGLFASISAIRFIRESTAAMKFGFISRALSNAPNAASLSPKDFHNTVPLFTQVSTTYGLRSKAALKASKASSGFSKRMDEKRLVAISEELGKTPAQILIRWAIQRGMVVLPKSVNENRIIENFAVFDFDISDSVMKRLDDLNERYVTCWDPHNPPPYAPV